MRTNFKTLTEGRKSSRITVSHPDIEGSSEITLELKAIAVLLGTNAFDSKIPYDESDRIRVTFNRLISEVKFWLR